MKRALVTGGSGDIGRAIARQLGAADLHVYVHGSRAERAQEVAARICEEGGSAEGIGFDITDGERTRTIISALVANEPIQVLIHCAGTHDDAPLAGMSAGQWHSAIDVSLHGFFNVSQPLLLPMLRTRWGRIIALSSVAAQMGNRGQANYAAAKAGLHGAVLSLAREVSSRGITANVIAPGLIEGRMLGNRFPPEQVRQLVPAGRLGRADEVAAVAAFLTSEAASYVSGQVIGVNGGMA